MERIVKALEKARLAGYGAPDHGSAAGSAPPPAGTATPFAYTRTRTVPVAPEFLRHTNVVAGFPSGPFVDAYKVLRTKVLQKMRERDWNVLAVAGASPASGATLTAVNLAISLAWEVNQTVLLVDANLRQPGVHRALGLDVSAGLADYLLEDTPIERILLHPEGIERFLVLPGGRPLAGSAELLSSPRMTHLADELKHRYPSRIVLFDLPPMTTSDTMAFLPRVDAVVLVAQEGGTTEAELQQAIAHLGQAPLLGTVLNQAEGDR